MSAFIKEIVNSFSSIEDYGPSIINSKRNEGG